MTIISVRWSPLLDIGLPKTSPQYTILRCCHPATAGHYFQLFGPSSRGTSYTILCWDVVSIRELFWSISRRFYDRYGQPTATSACYYFGLLLFWSFVGWSRACLLRIYCCKHKSWQIKIIYQKFNSFKNPYIDPNIIYILENRLSVDFGIICISKLIKFLLYQVSASN